MFELGFLADEVRGHLYEVERTGRLDPRGTLALQEALVFVKELEIGGKLAYSVGVQSAGVQRYRQQAARAYSYAVDAWKRSDIGVPSTKKELTERCARYRITIQHVLDGDTVPQDQLTELRKFFEEISARTLRQVQSRGLQ